MSNIKYRIELGNCEPGLGESIKDPRAIEAGLWTADSMIITADSKTALADGTTQ